MYEGNTVAVVVPAYNEAGFVGEVIETVPPFVDRVYAIDDASTDGTWGEIRRTASVANRRLTRPLTPAPDGGAAFEPRVVAIRHDENRGVGGAIKTGYRRAVEDGVDVVAVMNGDGQMDPDALDRILDPVVAGEADYAKGNRLGRPADRRPMSGWRLFGNVLLTALTRIASGYRGLTDPQNGYTAVSRSALEAIDLDAVHDGYGFCNDVLVRLNVAGLRVADVPMTAVYGDERSHIRYSTFVPLLSWLLLRDFLWRLRVTYGPTHPVSVLYGMGAAAAAAGALVGAAAGLDALADALPADGTAAPTLADVIGTSLAPGGAIGALPDAVAAAAAMALGGVLVAAAMALDGRHNAALEAGS